jgi:hypothetical protein
VPPGRLGEIGKRKSPKPKSADHRAPPEQRNAYAEGGYSLQRQHESGGVPEDKIPF